MTKVDCRLVLSDVSATPPAPAVSPAGVAPSTPSPPSRRALIGAGLGAGALALAGSGWWLTHRGGANAPPPEVAQLMEQAQTAMTQASPEGNAQAVGLYRRVVQLAPDYADGWGALAMAYAAAMHGRPGQFSGDMTARTRDAVSRARALDLRNAYAAMTLATLLPIFGNGLPRERAQRAAAREHPGTVPVLVTYAGLLQQTGRNWEAAKLLDRCLSIGGPSPGI